MTEEGLRSDIQTIYSKINELAINTAVQGEILHRIEDCLKKLPCEKHQCLIEKNKEQIYAFSKTGAAIYGLTLLTVSILGLVGKAFGWF